VSRWTQPNHLGDGKPMKHIVGADQRKSKATSGNKPRPSTIIRAREFINDVLRINAEHGMRSVEDKDIIEAAVADVAAWEHRLQ
jgi:hypothetical protein